MRLLTALVLLPVRIPALLVAKRHAVSPITWGIALLIVLAGASLGYFRGWNLGLKVALAGLGLLLLELWVVHDSPSRRNTPGRGKKGRRPKHGGASGSFLH